MKMVLTLLIGCSILFVVIISGVSCQIPREEKVQEVINIHIEDNAEDLDQRALTEMNGGKIDIHYDPQTGMPKQIDGIFSSRKIKTSEDALYAMMSVRSFMSIHGTQFACIGTDYSSDEINTYVFVQMYEGIAVDQSMFRIISNKDGTPRSLFGIYRNGININITPSITYKEGKKAISLNTGSYISSYQLVIYENKGEFLLSWKYFVDSKDPLQKKYVYVDAHTGSLIATTPTAIA